MDATAKACLRTYHLVDARDLRLENRDGVSDRRLGRSVGGDASTESALLHGGERLELARTGDNLRKHPLIIINIDTILCPI